MKSKAIITCVLVSVCAILFSFSYGGENPTSNVALVNSVFGKENEGFMVSYGDGSVELKKFEFKRHDNANHLQTIPAVAQIMNTMFSKGYRYAGVGNHTVNDIGVSVSYLVFEKK